MAASTSPYRSLFVNGATLYPRMLCLVERAEVGRLGASGAAPVVQSRQTGLDKPPWKDIPPLRGQIETAFLRPLFLGEFIAPFRLLDPELAIVPWDRISALLLDFNAADAAGYPHLARWLASAEQLWNQHRRSPVSLTDQLNHFGKLVAQFPTQSVRVVYAKSGTLPAAALLRDQEALIDHMLYWTSIEHEEEAYYLVAILNSEEARARIAGRQSRGQWGARHFDKVMLELPIPRFDPDSRLHQDLAKEAKDAERLAAAVVLREGMHFSRARKAIRDALRANGVAGKIDVLWPSSSTEGKTPHLDGKRRAKPVAPSKSEPSNAYALPHRPDEGSPRSNSAR